MHSESHTTSESGLSFRKLLIFGSQPVDIASAAVFRIAFGAIAAIWAWDYLTLGRVKALYVDPKFNFTYYGFDWVQPWSGIGMYVHFWVLLVLALCIAAGLMYRLSSLLFALGFTYVFLLDRTNYQNHYYLLSLISWWLPILPLHRSYSLDAKIWPKRHSESIPAWVLWVLQFHVAMPYFMGGIAKFDADWLLGAPMHQMLRSKSDWPVVGEFFAAQGTGVALAWAGMLFDLFVVPALIWKRTRWIAFLSCMVFHLMNSMIFNIHIFPWFMLAATTLFFDPSWPRRFLTGYGVDNPVHRPAFDSVEPNLGLVRKFGFGLLLAYAVFHGIWPLRHNLYPGHTGWHERGHYFAWRMMLRGKTTVLGYALKDKETGRVADGTVGRFLNPEQSEKFGRDPAMVLHFAHFLGEEYEKTTGRECEVYALVLTSLNGRKPQLLVDPNTNLLEEARGLGPQTWVTECTEPLRKDPWDAPPAQWKQLVEIPELEFLDSGGNTAQPASGELGS